MDTTTITIGYFLLQVSVSESLCVCVFKSWAINLSLFTGDVKLSWPTDCLVFVEPTPKSQMAPPPCGNP